MNLLTRKFASDPFIVNISIYELVRKSSTSNTIMYRLRFPRPEIELRETKHGRLLVVWL